MNSRPLRYPAVAVTKDAQVSVDTRRSSITLGRYHHAAPGRGREVRSDSEDAYLISYDFVDYPRHPVLVDGTEKLAKFSPTSSVQIFDLAHSYAAVHDDPIDCLHIHFPRTALEDLAMDAGCAIPAALFTPGDEPVGDATMDRLAQALKALTRGGEAASPLFSGHLILSVAAHLAACYGGLRKTPLFRGGLAPWQERRAKEMISANNGIVTLAALSAECDLSATYFSKAFKATTGHTPHRWAQRLRIERAQGLLMSKAALSEIASACGFANQAHFTRVFRQHVGETPGAWRARRS